MCGRYTQTNTAPELARRFLLELPLLEAEHQPRYNIAPSQGVLAVAAGPASVRLPFWPKWGLVRSWAKEAQAGPINARSETVAQKPVFRGALRQRRCLVVADGFYEWARSDGGAVRLPFRITLKDGGPFGFAGLWERRVGPDGVELTTCCLLTTAANELVRPIHDRMPVIVRPELETLWLDPEQTDPAALTPVYEPYPAREMTAYPVSRRVNSPRNDDPACVAPVA